jgi:membrane-associated phospholipid phosphatase
MGSWLRSLIWRLQHWDAALSQQIMLKRTEDQPRAPLDWLALLGAHLGDSWLWAIVAGLLFRDAFIHSDQDEGRRTKLIGSCVISAILSIGATLLIKRQVQRPRPNRGNLLYGSGPDVHSFPSGHAARLSAIAIWTPLLQGKWGWAAWLLAFYVGWSRVALGIHYAGDVVVGWMLGGVIGLVCQGLRREDDKR